MTNRNYCTNCGEEMPIDVPFCGNCGVAKGTANNFCANCGSAVIAGSAFCTVCGAKLPVESMQQNNQQPAMVNNNQNAGNTNQNARHHSNLLPWLIGGVFVLIVAVVILLPKDPNGKFVYQKIDTSDSAKEKITKTFTISGEKYTFHGVVKVQQSDGKYVNAGTTDEKGKVKYKKDKIMFTNTNGTSIVGSLAKDHKSIIYDGQNFKKK